MFVVGLCSARHDVQGHVVCRAPPYIYLSPPRDMTILAENKSATVTHPEELRAPVSIGSINLRRRL